ncbi:hypothetical protein FHR47_001257 [Xanthomonas arboricola]|nr:hypothetical protein [Xanthomonas cannabis]
MQIERLDHLLLTMADVDATCALYARVLGMQVISVGETACTRVGQRTSSRRRCALAVRSLRRGQR